MGWQKKKLLKIKTHLKATFEHCVAFLQKYTMKYKKTYYFIGFSQSTDASWEVCRCAKYIFGSFKDAANIFSR